MSKIVRAVEVETEEGYLSLGDLRALVTLAEGMDDAASIYNDNIGLIDHLRVEETLEEDA